MRPAKAAGGLPAKADGEPQKNEWLPRRLVLKKILVPVKLQAKNLAALAGVFDPAHVAGLLFALIGGPRQ